MLTNMQVITPQQQAARQNELDQEEVSRLTRSAHKKGKGSVPFNILQTKHGLDGDYSPADWGMEKGR